MSKGRINYPIFQGIHRIAWTPPFGNLIRLSKGKANDHRLSVRHSTNTFVTLLHDLTACEGVTNALRLLPGFQRAAYTFLGKAVNRRIARIADVRAMDINMFLTLS